jgi:hypothetical protein
MAPDPDHERRALIGAHAHRMVSTPEWDLFTLQVKEVEMKHAESLITAKDDWRFEQGIIQGIREVMRLPSLLIAQGRR